MYVFADGDILHWSYFAYTFIYCGIFHWTKFGSSIFANSNIAVLAGNVQRDLCDATSFYGIFFLFPTMISC